MNSEGFVWKFVCAIDKLLLIQSFRSRAQELCEEGGGLSLAGAATSYHFCRDKLVLVATKVCLSRQNIFVATKYFCRDKSFVATTSTCLSRQEFRRDYKHTLKNIYIYKTSYLLTPAHKQPSQLRLPVTVRNEVNTPIPEKQKTKTKNTDCTVFPPSALPLRPRRWRRRPPRLRR